MRCKQARRELALWVGGDHDPRLYPLLESHLESCPECRAFAREIKSSLDPLRAVSSVSPATVGSSSDNSSSDGIGGGWSLWPSVQARLSRRRVQFNDLLDTPVGWVPVTGLTVACLTLFIVVFNTSHVTSQQQLTGFDAPMLNQTPVSYPFDHSNLMNVGAPRESFGPLEYDSSHFDRMVIPHREMNSHPLRLRIRGPESGDEVEFPVFLR